MPRKKLVMRYKGLIEGDPLAAILRMAADLELLLSEKLFFEHGIPFGSTERWSLGRLISEASTAKLLTPDETAKLRRFVELRNKVIHWRGVVSEILQSEKAASSMKIMLAETYEFIESAQPAHVAESDPENRYSEASQRVERWIGTFWE